MPQIIICTPPLKIFNYYSLYRKVSLFFFCMFCLLMFVYHVSVEPEGVRSPGTRVKGSCKLPFEPKPSARKNAINAEQPLHPVSNFTNWHSHLCFAMVNLLCLQYPLSWIMALTSPTLCLILTQQSLNINSSFLAPHLITTLSSLNLSWLSTRPLMTDSVCSESSSPPTLNYCTLRWQQWPNCCITTKIKFAHDSQKHHCFLSHRLFLWSPLQCFT